MSFRQCVSMLGFLAGGILCIGPAASAQVVPNGITPQQQQALYLRALQMRGRGQVRTGYPQDIPLGDPGAVFAPQVEPQQGTTATGKSTSQKRIEARKTRDEQKRAARDDAQAKKAKAVKKPVKQAPAKAAKQPKKVDSDKSDK